MYLSLAARLQDRVKVEAADAGWGAWMRPAARTAHTVVKVATIRFISFTVQAAKSQPTI
jgi:hypothetical protein